jgi:hypothetical protein
MKAGVLGHSTTLADIGPITFLFENWARYFSARISSWNTGQAVVIGARYVINCEITFWTSTRLGALHRFVSAMEQIQIGYFTSCSLSVGVVHRFLTNPKIQCTCENSVDMPVRSYSFEITSICDQFAVNSSWTGHSTPPAAFGLLIYHLTQPPRTRPLKFFFFFLHIWPVVEN